MADYKVVFRADDTSTGDAALLWEQSCPAMLTAVQVSRNVQTSEAYLQVKVRNVSGVKLESVYGIAAVNYIDGSSDAVEFEDLDVDLAPGGQKALKAKALPKGDVEAVMVKLNQIALQDDKWSSSGEPAAIPGRIPVALSDKAMTERRRKLEEAGVDPRTYDFSVQDKGDWWVCACGQVNVGTDVCCECGASKTALLCAENELQLLASADEWSETVYQKALSLSGDKGNLAALTEAEELFDRVKNWKDASERIARCETQIAAIKRRTRRIAITAAVIVVAAIAAAMLALNVFIPDSKYAKARSLEESGQYDEAIAAFESLDDYKDSRARIFGIAERLYQAGEYQKAARAFESLGDYEGAAEKAKECLIEVIDGALQGRWRMEHKPYFLEIEFDGNDFNIVEGLDEQLQPASGGTYKINLDEMAVIAYLDYGDGNKVKIAFPLLYDEDNLQLFLNSGKEDKFSKL